MSKSELTPFLKWGDFKSQDQNNPDVLEMQVSEVDTFETAYSINVQVLQKVNGKWIEKILPLKSVELKSDNNAKFRVNVEGTSYDAEVRYTIQPDYKYVLEVVSGDLKGTKMITTLTETWGFDGTPNAGTIVNMKVTLETSWFVSFIMFFVGDHQIRSALDTGVYLLAEHAKKLPVQVSSQNIETKNIEAARKLEPEKEALKSKSQDSGYQGVSEETKSNLEKQLEIAKKKGKQAEIEIKKEKPSQSILVSTDRVSYADGETIVVFGKVSEYVPNVQATIVITNPIGQRVYLEQVEVGTDKTYSTEITAGGSLWKNTGTYTMIVQYGSEYITNQTTFQFSGSKVGSSVNTIKVEQTDFSVSYIITNGMVTGMKAEPQGLSLIILIQANDGHITVTLPRTLIDAKKYSSNEDDKFFVLIDGSEVSYKETKSTTTRTLSIGFLKGDSTIEIIGTHVTTH